MEHKLKIQLPFADAICKGYKTFEVRKNDRGFQKGDFVRFTVLDGAFDVPHHPILSRLYRISYVLSGWGIEEGYVVFGIYDVPESLKEDAQCI